MSHAYLAHRCIIRNPLAVKMATDQMKYKGVKALRFETAEEVCKRKGLPYKPKSAEHPACGEYRSYRTEYGKWVGDYPSPPGMKPDEVSFNADFVISLTDECQSLILHKQYGPSVKEAYEIGLVWVEAQTFVDPITGKPTEVESGWYPVHDFWRNGCGIETIVGPTKTHYDATAKVGGEMVIDESHGLLMQMVRQMEEILAVAETQDEYHRVELPDGSVVTRKYPGQRVRA